MPVKLCFDIQAAISIVHNPVHNNRMEDIEIDPHFIKEEIDGGLVCMMYVPTGDQVVDTF